MVVGDVVSVVVVSLVVGVEVVVALIKKILAATEEQANQGDQIVEAIQVFRDVADASDRQREEMQTSLRELSERSIELETEIGRFQL